MGPLIGLEYLIEIQEYDHENKEPSYLCMLCDKRGDPRTVMAHLVSYNHRLSYLQKHFPASWRALAPYSTRQYKRGWQLTIHKISEAMEMKFGRLKPISVERELFERKRTFYNETIENTDHFDERQGTSFEHLVDGEAIKKAAETTEQEELEMKRAAEKAADLLQRQQKHSRRSGNEPGCLDSKDKNNKRSPSPPVVAKPSRKPKSANSGNPNRRSLSPVSSISSSSLSSMRSGSRSPTKKRATSRRRSRSRSPYYRRRRRTRTPSPHRGRDHRRDYRRSSRDHDRDRDRDRDKDRDRRDRLPWQRPDYQRPRSRDRDHDSTRSSKPKTDKLEEFKKQCQSIESEMEWALKQHEKNPEKHPQYNDEWKKFWNKRYKELQAEGKDHAQHDFKPEWIEFWNKRMIEMHLAEIKAKKDSARKRLNLPDEPAPISFKILAKKKSNSNSNINPNNNSSNPSNNPSNNNPSFINASSNKICLDDLNMDAVSDTSLEAPAAPDSDVIIIEEDKDEDTRSHSTKRSHSPWEVDAGSHRSRNRNEPKFDWRKDLSPMSKTVLMRERDFDPYKPPRVMREATRKPVLGTPPHLTSSSCQDDEDGEVNVIGVLRLLTAMEDHLGSLGPKVIDMLSQALALEKAEPNSAETLMDNEVNCVLIETVKEKLKGLSDDRMGMVNYIARKRFKLAITKVASLLHFAAERKREVERQRPKTDPIKVPGIGTIDKAAIAKQIANALIMQGKTDVTTVELEQLIDAVVGMAQASQGAAKPITTANFLQQMAVKPTETIITPSVRVASKKEEEEPCLSALQLIQGAYSAEMAATNMDGLSDSDLQTLLQNFKDLSTEEQHGLITYLKKLESKEPERVERLRKFVNLDGGIVTVVEEKAGSVGLDRSSPFSCRPGGTNPDLAEVLGETDPEINEDLEKTKQPHVKLKIDSDDEEYSFEDVFKAASKNLKEKENKEKQNEQKKIIEEAITQSSTTVASEPASKESTKNLMDTKTLIANIIGQFGDKSFNSSVTNLLGMQTSSTSSSPLTAAIQSGANASPRPLSRSSSNPMAPFQTTHLQSTPHSNQFQLNKPVQYPLPGAQQVQYPNTFGQHQSQSYPNINPRAPVSYPQQSSYNRGFNQQGHYQQSQNNQQQNQYASYDYSGGNSGGYMGNNPGLRPPGTGPQGNNQFQPHPGPRGQQNFQQFGGNRFY